MCGLAGCLLAPGQSVYSLEKVKEIFIANLLANEDKGKEATGVVACDCAGSFSCEKAPLPVHEFVKTRKFERFMGNFVTQKTTILLGHAREPTKGTTANNFNNHPIIVGNTIGVHNGIIRNDDEIFANLSDQEHVLRQGAVDSEAIMALFDQVDSVGKLTSFVKGVKGATELLSGSFTTLFFNRLIPQRLICLRYDNPISLHYDLQTNALFFSSRYVFLRKTFGRVVIGPSMPARTGFVFDANYFADMDGRPVEQFDL